MTVPFNHGGFMAELRKRQGKIPADLYADMMAALELGLSGPAPKPADPREPGWLSEARQHMGLKEIPGAKHNATILGWVKTLGGWFKDDETPWCGTFVGYCIQAAGLRPVQHWYRAKAWADWGRECPPRVGAIVVFGRQGGGHVGFLVGESAANYYVLGGNQSNQVNITPIAKSRKLAIRWPSEVPLGEHKLPAMSGGTVSVNEA